MYRSNQVLGPIIDPYLGLWTHHFEGQSPWTANPSNFGLSEKLNYPLIITHTKWVLYISLYSDFP
jgi:hypothetical protein